MIFQVNVDRLIYNGMCMVIKMDFLIDFIVGLSRVGLSRVGLSSCYVDANHDEIDSVD